MEKLHKSPVFHSELKELSQVTHSVVQTIEIYAYSKSQLLICESYWVYGASEDNHEGSYSYEEVAVVSFDFLFISLVDAEANV
jgi:hypothetical protein